MSCLNLSDQELLKVIEPMVESMLHGEERRNYSQFSTNFSVHLKSLLSPEQFEAENKHRAAEWGRPGERIVATIFRKEKSFTVIWKIEYSNTTNEVLLLVTVAIKGGRYFIDHLLLH